MRQQARQTINNEDPDHHVSEVSGLRVFNRSIDVHVAALRQKLGDDAKEPRFTRAIRAIEYMLINPDACNRGAPST